MLRPAFATVAVLIAASFVVLHAADVPLGGARLTVQNPTSDTTRRAVKLDGRSSAGSPALADDPSTTGATLQLTTTGGTSADQTFDLPALGWTSRLPSQIAYSSRNVGGAVTSLSLKRTASGILKLKAGLSGRYWALDVVPPNPGDTAVLQLTIGAGDRYCLTFGGAAGGVESRDDAAKWQVRSATSVPCPPLPTTTTTTPDTTTTSTIETTTTTSTTFTTTTSTITTTSSTTTSSASTTTTTSSTTTSTTAPSTTTTTMATSTTITTSTTTTTTTAQSTTSTSTTTTTEITTTSTTTTPTTNESTTSTTTTTTSTTTSPTTTATSTTTTTATTSTTTSSTTTTTTTTSTTTTTLVVELNLLYVHGLKSCTGSRQNAAQTLVDLESAVNTALPARIATWQAAHPGVHVVTHSARANVYTATSSGIHPSDSTDPLAMDDWEVGDPGCSTTQQGQPCTTAYEWRYRLAKEINRLFPAPAKNVILIGHSNGARVAMEVASNTGTGGVGSQDWGVQSRIAGVVSLNGVIDDVGTSKYNVVGVASFESSCKNGDAITGFGDSCAPGNGFCEMVGRIDASPGADWVARNKRALMLTSWGSCSPSAWTGQNDGTLPYDAQASQWAVGLDTTPAPNQTYREAHGIRYGAFCHSDITDASKANHGAARDAARDRFLDWLFVAAPRVAAVGTNTTASIGFNQSTVTFTMGSSCGTGEVDDTLTSGTKGLGLDVVGVCKHPGFFDGDDHAIALSEFTVTNGATCNGTYKWKQAHDSNNNHAAAFWWKTRSVSANGPGLVGTLPTN